MNLANPEESEWRQRAGNRGEIRAHAQRMDPNTRAFCRECQEMFTGTIDSLTEQMVKHYEEEHGKR